MKKKLLVLMSVSVMSAMLVTACGAKDTTQTVEPSTEESSFWDEESSEAVESASETETETVTEEETETTTETETDVVTADGEWHVSEKYDPYLEWTNKEWEAASDDEKINVCIAYTAYVSVATNVGTAEEMIEALELPESLSQLDTVLSTLESMYEVPEIEGMKLKEVADLGLSQLQ